jgi:LEA14-like dessication related protein
MALLLLLQGCRVYRDVEFKGVKETRFTSFNANGVSCEFDVELYNPNPYNITLIESTVDLYLEGTKVGRVNLPEKAVLSGDDKTLLKLSCTADPSSIPKLVGGAISMVFKKELLFEGKGMVKAKAFLLSKTVPVEFVHKLRKEDLGF